MSARAGWIEIPGTHEFNYKGRLYRNMVRFERPCATCGENFGIFVTQKVAQGGASSNNFGMRNCEKHRQKRVQFNGKNLGEPQVTTGFPHTTVENGKYTTELRPPPGTLAEILQELENLRTANATMKEELEGLYAQNKELREQTAPASAQQYKLPPSGGFNAKTIDPALSRNEELLQKWLAKNNTKMPWEDA